MYFDYKTLEKFTEKDFKYLKDFTYKDGMARPIFEQASLGKLLYSEKYFLTTLRHDYHFLIGWSLVYPSLKYLEDTCSYMCFVRPLFRKNGNGKKLFEESIAKFGKNKQLLVYGWDERSKNFYSKLKEENLHKKQIEIL